MARFLCRVRTLEDAFRRATCHGDLTSDGSKSYSWNTRDQPTGISGRVSPSCDYDGLGRRRSKTVGSTTTQFL
jgi:hypothetical protein